MKNLRKGGKARLRLSDINLREGRRKIGREKKDGREGRGKDNAVKNYLRNEGRGKQRNEERNEEGVEETGEYIKKYYRNKAEREGRKE